MQFFKSYTHTHTQIHVYIVDREVLGKKHSLTLLISVARCRCNLSHGNDNIPRTKLIHQCRCKTSLHIHDYIIYLTNYLFNLVFACALVSLFVLLIWIILVTWHRYFAYTTNIHIYTLYTCVYIYAWLLLYATTLRMRNMAIALHFVCAVRRVKVAFSYERVVISSLHFYETETQTDIHSHTYTVNTDSTVLASIRDL